METNPYESPQDGPMYVKPAPGNGAIFKAWIVFFLLSVVGGLVVGMVVGAIAGGALGAGGVSMEQIRFICTILGFVVSIPISFLSFFFSVKTFLLS